MNTALVASFSTPNALRATNPAGAGAATLPPTPCTTAPASVASELEGAAFETGSSRFDADQPEHLHVPYGGQRRMQLTLASGVAEARVRIDPQASELLSLRSFGLQTRLSVSPSEVRVSWPWTFGTWLRHALAGTTTDVELVLHPAVEWTICVRGGLSSFSAELAAGQLAGIDISGGISNARFELPTPKFPVPIRVAGGVSELTLRRPTTTGVSLAINGGVSMLHLDQQEFGSIGGSRLVSGAVDGDTPRYVIEIRGGASGVCVTGP